MYSCKFLLLLILSLICASAPIVAAQDTVTDLSIRNNFCGIRGCVKPSGPRNAGGFNNGLSMCIYIIHNIHKALILILNLSRIGKRVLMSFKETPSGSNVTFECSPSGPCIACAYSEKSEDKYRCSETGYRIPMKCVELESSKKEANVEKGDRKLADIEVKSDGTVQRSLLADKSTSDHKLQAYITYKSCVPAVNEEKLSLVGFEIAFGYPMTRAGNEPKRLRD